MSRFAPMIVIGALSAIVVGITPAASQAADREPGQHSAAQASGWTKALAVDLSRDELGLPARAQAGRFARAALDRYARRLGLSRSSGRLRLASQLRLPSSAGGRVIRTLRFQQTAGGLRVLWSQIDVTIADGEVSSISATVVRAKGHALVGKRKVSRARAMRIARRAVPKAEAALRPLAAAYAGTPGTNRTARWRRPRRVWVVEVQPPAAAGDDASAGLCIVIDAQAGKVIARWPGLADRPDRGPDARSASRALPASAAFGLAQLGQHTQLQIGDARDGAVGAPPYARYSVSGDPRAVEWPHLPVPRVQGAAHNILMDMAATNARNIARTICDLRGYCGVDGGFRDRTDTYSGTVTPWQVGARAPESTKALTGIGVIQLQAGDEMGFNSSNDLLAHEFGHLMDASYAGDRLSGQELEGDSVEEALADMFAYEYDRFDSTLGEEHQLGARINWEDPSEISLVPGRPYPDHIRDYDPSPPNESDGKPSEHFNSTILSHAYYLFVQAVGHHKAGRVLHNVPATLSPKPTFREVARGFVGRAGEIYPQDGPDSGTRSDMREAAEHAFDQVGIGIRDHRGEQPG